ncbi:hypothetical protein GQ44DRAFT_220246 [Phaeosphaeriaceae sp. PMI808]|nr:hypothetical protein GQ44DRAFT_220246 [Phaeosphaeriaceae sp. PMI808]
MEAINGITFRCPVTKTIVPIDLIDRSTEFEPKTEALQSFEAGKLPWASRDDLISMKHTVHRREMTSRNSFEMSPILRVS